MLVCPLNRPFSSFSLHRSASVCLRTTTVVVGTACVYVFMNSHRPPERIVSGKYGVDNANLFCVFSHFYFWQKQSFILRLSTRAVMRMLGTLKKRYTVKNSFASLSCSRAPEHIFSPFCRINVKISEREVGRVITVTAHLLGALTEFI